VQKQKLSCYPRLGYAGLIVAVIVLLLMASPVSAVSAESGPTDVYIAMSVHLQVGEKGTGTPVPQVSVYLDGNPAGTTDDSGSITLSHVMVKTHTLKFVKSGYQDSSMSFTPSCNPGSCPSPEELNLNVMVPSPANLGQVSTTPVSGATQTISPYANVQNGVTPQAYRTQAVSPSSNGFQNGVTPQAYRTQAVSPSSDGSQNGVSPQGGSVTPGGKATQQTTSGILVFTPFIALVLVAGITVMSRYRNPR
jgi:hypothetical protein